ncbi:MAG: tRNA (cytidine(56)-2'-O)-methyltransferase [Candidatus Altiarchaeota archaeon]
MRVVILRLGHRYGRDKRLSTHIALTARAFGASEVVFDAVDSGVKKSIEGVNSAWGGGFRVSFTDNWKRYVKEFNGDVVHLTMYGLNINSTIGRIRKSRKNKLIVVGSQKVPSELYQMADYNIAVGSQPHSEVAALAVFLDRLFNKKELELDFKGKRTIFPQERGKKVVELTRTIGYS